MLVLSLLMESEFRLMLEGFLQLANLVLKITQVLVELLLFLLQFLGVKLFALPGIETVSVSVNNDQSGQREVIRRLSVS